MWGIHIGKRDVPAAPQGSEAAWRFRKSMHIPLRNRQATSSAACRTGDFQPKSMRKIFVEQELQWSLSADRDGRALRFFTQLIEQSDDLFSSHRRELLEKLIDAVSRFEVIEERLNGYARASEARGTMHDLRIRGDEGFHSGTFYRRFSPYSTDNQGRHG
jgi:hypothetical protein